MTPPLQAREPASHTGPSGVCGQAPRSPALAPPRPVAPSLCHLHDVGRCGSCPHLDLPLADQLDAKQARTTSLLASHVPGHAWQAPCPSAPTRFRNKAKMVVGGSPHRPTLGILDGAGQGVDLRSCPLHVPAVQEALPVLADLVSQTGIRPYDVARRTGELKHVLVTASPDDDLMVRFVLRTHSDVDRLRAALPALRDRLPQLAVASVNIQAVHQAVIEGDEEILLSEEDQLLMRLRLPGPRGGSGHPAAGPHGGVARPERLLLNLPTRSFFQTNTEVAQSLYATARDWAEDPAGPPPGTVWDLFCGVGGFALALAAPGRRVLGVEVSGPAVAGARRAARMMGLDALAARFEAGDARVLDPGERADEPRPDLVVVNPPRRGIGPELAERIEASGVGRVLYSSCNPASLAADLGHMPSLRPARARLFDMFPHTDHAEVLVELRRS